MGPNPSPTAESVTVSCPCGASMKVELGQGPQEMVCPECGQILEVVVAVDPATKKKRVGILVKPAAVAPRRSKPKAAVPGGKGEEVHTAKCTCGAQLTIVPTSPDAIFTCPACDAEYTATLRQGRSGVLSTLLLRPVVAMPVAGKPAVRASAPSVASAGKPPKLAPPSAPAPPVKPAAPSATARPAQADSPSGAMPAKESLLLTAKGDIGAQQLIRREEGRAFLCHCGKEIALKANYQHELLKCPDCGLTLRVFAAINPKTKKPMIITLPRGPLPPQPKAK